jgi:hypothetical protein
MAEPKLIAELQADRDYQGVIYNVAFDHAGDVWMATRGELYNVEGQRAKVIDAVSGTQDQIALAPDGGIYARLLADGAPAGLFRVQLLKLQRPKEPIAELRPRAPPDGFGAIYLGGAGQLIVTVTPLDNSEGLRGRFRYAFWSGEGQLISETVLEGLRTGVVATAGDALLLLGEDDAVALDNRGRELWRRAGRYRKGALAAEGNVALLNPAQKSAIAGVEVVRNRATTEVTAIKTPAAVYDLALTADGSVGAVAVDEGKLLFVKPLLCKGSSCEERAASPLLPDEKGFLVSAVRFVDPATAVVGLIQREGEQPPYTWPSAAVVVVNTSDQVLFKARLTLQQPTTWTPSIDVSHDARFFAAHTPDKVVIVSLDR